MPATRAPSEVMRVVIPASLKGQFQARCAARGQNMSERIRQMIVEDVSTTAPTAADRLSAILSSAKAKNEASGLREPTIDEVDAFIERVRDERIAAGMVQ